MVKNNTKFKETELGPIPEEWDVLAVNHIADVVGGGTPSTKSAENFGGEIPWITPRDLSNFRDRFIERGERNISKLGLNSSNARLLPKGTVLLSSRAPVGYLAIAAKEVTTNQGFQSLVPNEKVDNIFLYYLLKNNTQRLIDNASGSTFQELSGKTLKSMIFAFPKIKEQKSISSILSSLDDKIELNRQINANLEKTASALFKRWFVDFEFPDKNGKPYRSSGGKMVESEMGEIPKGWRVGKLGDIAKNIKRSIKASDITSDKPYIGLEHMPRHSISLSEWGSGEGLGSNKFEFKQGEILFGKLRPYFHKVGVAPVDGVCSTDILVVAPKEQEYFGFALGHISSEIFIKFTEGSSSGTRMPRTNWSDMAKYEVILPPMPVVSTFSEIIYSLINLLLENVLENHTLAAQRDFLLPRLMSGKIRMK